MNQESKCLEHTEMTPWESPAMAYMMSESNASLTNLPFDRHAARARLSDDEYTELEGRWGDTLMLENIVPSSVGFFSVRFG